MSDLLLLRHGQSEWNHLGRWQGWADPPLSELGLAQAADAAEALRELGFDAVASSDLQRARRSAEIIANGLGLGEVDVEPQLRERNVGDFSGLTRAQIEERFPGVVQAWNDRVIDRPPNGESDDEFLPRIMNGLDALAHRHPGQRVVVVAHGGVLRTVRRHLAGEPGGLEHLGGVWVHLSDDGWGHGEPWLLPADRGV